MPETTFTLSPVTSLSLFSLQNHEPESIYFSVKFSQYYCIISLAFLIPHCTCETPPVPCMSRFFILIVVKYSITWSFSVWKWMYFQLCFSIGKYMYPLHFHLHFRISFSILIKEECLVRVLYSNRTNRIYTYIWPYIWGFPDSSVGKPSTCNAGDPGLIPGSGRSLKKG